VRRAPRRVRGAHVGGEEDEQRSGDRSVHLRESKGGGGVAAVVSVGVVGTTAGRDVAWGVGFTVAGGALEVSGKGGSSSAVVARFALGVSSGSAAEGGGSRTGS